MTTKSPASQMIESVLAGQDPRRVVREALPNYTVLARAPFSKLDAKWQREFRSEVPASSQVTLEAPTKIINQPGSKPDGILVVKGLPPVKVPKLHMHELIVALGGNDHTYIG